jgi:hypothetical protein
MNIYTILWVFVNINMESTKEKFAEHETKIKEPSLSSLKCIRFSVPQTYFTCRLWRSFIRPLCSFRGRYLFRKGNHTYSWQGLLFGERLTTMGSGLTAVGNILSPHAPRHEDSASSAIKGGINSALVRDFCHQKSHPGQK